MYHILLMSRWFSIRIAYSLGADRACTWRRAECGAVFASRCRAGVLTSWSRYESSDEGVQGGRGGREGVHSESGLRVGVLLERPVTVWRYGGQECLERRLKRRKSFFRIRRQEAVIGQVLQLVTPELRWRSQ